MQNSLQFPQTIHLFTHNDLDGIACAVLYAKAFPNVVPHFLDYAESTEHIMDFATDDQTSKIVITDMGINEDLAAFLDARGDVELIDHHPTSIHLMHKYAWVFVNSVSGSATKLVYDLLSITFNLSDYLPFVTLVDDYDSWGHHTKPQPLSHDFARLVRILGVNRFFHRVVLLSSLELSPTEVTLLTMDKEYEQNYIEESVHLANLCVDSDGYKFAVLASDRYQNVSGDAILTEIPQIEYVMLMDFRKDKVSLRGRGNVDLGLMAQELGGGGHKRAAGFPLNSFVQRMFTEGPDVPAGSY